MFCFKPHLFSDFLRAAPLLDSPFTHGELGAILPPGNEALRDYINGFIDKERQSGRLDELKSIYLHGRP